MLSKEKTFEKSKKLSVDKTDTELKLTLKDTDTNDSYSKSMNSDTISQLTNSLFSDIESFYETLIEYFNNSSDALSIMLADVQVLDFTVVSIIGKNRREFKFKITLDLVSSSSLDSTGLSTIMSMLQKIDNRLNSMDNRLNSVDMRLDLMSKKIVGLEQREDVAKRLFSCKTCNKDLNEYNFCKNCENTKGSDKKIVSPLSKTTSNEKKKCLQCQKEFPSDHIFVYECFHQFCFKCCEEVEVMLGYNYVVGIACRRNCKPSTKAGDPNYPAFRKRMAETGLY